MLKLTRTQSGLNLSFCERATFWTPTLFLAAGIALAVHLIGWLLFSIQPFFMNYAPALPPVQVKTSPTSHTSVAITAAKDTSNLPPPTISLPADFDALPAPQLLFSSQNDHPFESLQERYWPIASLVMPANDTPISAKVMISGNLSERVLLHHWNKPLPDEASAGIMSFLVQADPHTGKLFWIDPLQTSPTWAKEILQQLVFSVDGSSWDGLDGRIDLVLSP